MAGTDQIDIHQGEDVTLNFLMDPVVDISDWTLEFNVLGASAIEVTVAGTVVSGSEGTFSVALTDAETDNLEPGHYLYDVWRTDAGSERVLARGVFSVISVARNVGA